MRLDDAFRSSINALRHAKVRSLLTMLGIVIGISSVILLMSIGTSAQELILNQVQGIGSNLIFIIPGSSGNSKFSSPAAAQGIIITTLVKDDVDAIAREPSVVRVVPEVRGQAHVVYGNNDSTVRNFTLREGYPFTTEDVDSFNHVAVLGSEISKTLFGDVTPVGKLIRLKDVSFRVVGVMDSKGLGPFGIDQDNVVIIPLTVAQKQLLGINYYNNITVQASDTYNSSYVESRLTSILRQDHRITDPNKDDFTIRTQQDALTLLGSITSVLNVFLTAIASISLVVGGIGIMNIMLVSVVERTREIGLRKAVGASDKDILTQFLLESILLTFLGGIVGITIGAAFAGLTYLVLSKALATGWQFAFPLSAILLAVAVSTFTGVVFGLYPARQAARKNPIDALRYE